MVALGSARVLSARPFPSTRMAIQDMLVKGFRGLGLGLGARGLGFRGLGLGGGGGGLGVWGFRVLVFGV